MSADVSSLQEAREDAAAGEARFEQLIAEDSRVEPRDWICLLYTSPSPRDRG